MSISVVKFPSDNHIYKLIPGGEFKTNSGIFLNTPDGRVTTRKIVIGHIVNWNLWIPTCTTCAWDNIISKNGEPNSSV